MEILQTLPLTGITNFNEKFVQQAQKGSCFHWKRTFCLFGDEDKKVAIISFNIFERMMWSCQNIFFNYSKLKKVFPTSKEIINISPTLLLSLMESVKKILNFKSNPNGTYPPNENENANLEPQQSNNEPGQVKEVENIEMKALQVKLQEATGLAEVSKVLKEDAQEKFLKSQEQLAQAQEKVTTLEKEIEAQKVKSETVKEDNQAGQIKEKADLEIESEDDDLTPPPLTDEGKFFLDLGSKYIDEEKYYKADKALSKAVGYPYEINELRATLAVKFYEMDDIDKAFANAICIKDIAKLKLLYINIAQAYKKKGMDDEALEALQALVNHGKLMQINYKSFTVKSIKDKNYDLALEGVMTSGLNVDY